MAEQYLTLGPPPGIAKGGTDYNTKGLWADSQLVRYYAGTHQPVGGWVRMVDPSSVNIAHLTGIPVACLAWRPNPTSSTDDGPPLIAIGTSDRLYAIVGQTLADISPLNPIPATNVAPWPTPTITVTGALKTSGSTASGATTATLVGTTLTGTFNAGDTLIFGATDAITANTDIVVVQATAVAAGNAATVTFSPAVTQTWGTGTNVVYIAATQRDSGYTGSPAPGTFGYSTFGSGPFGVGGTSTAFTWATTWSLDTLGAFLVAMSTADGILYVWQDVAGTPAAAPVWGITTTGPITTSGATAANSPTIAITATTLTGTILQGQRFTIAGVEYIALASATAAANIVTVQVTPLAPAAGIPGGTAVTVVPQAPPGRCTFVTPEGYLCVGGADGQARNVRWADRRSFTQWGATAYNTAGAYPIPTSGKIMAGKRTRNQTLIWTDTDVWAMTWIGAPLVYRFDQVGDHCGVISPNAMTVSGTQAVWMGQNCFWVYDGYTRQLPCPCKDFVFNNMNQQQVAKIWSMAIPEFGEVWWFYPSSGSTEIDSYVMYEQHESEASGQPIWYLGTLKRSCGSSEQALGTAQFPIMVAPTGEVYNHETGSMRTGEAAAFLQSGPIELGAGDTVYAIKQIIADEKTLGDTQFQLTYALYPGLPSGAGLNMGVNPQTLTVPRFTTAPTDVRVMARQVELKFIENQAVQWRVGKPRLKVAAGGPR